MRQYRFGGCGAALMGVALCCAFASGAATVVGADLSAGTAAASGTATAVGTATAAGTATATGITTAANSTKREQAAAETFVKLTLRLGAMTGHEEEVDSYFGPQALRSAAQNAPGSLGQLRQDAQRLLSKMTLDAATHRTPRRSRLLVQLRSFAGLLETIGPAARAETFEDEARRVYARSVSGGAEGGAGATPEARAAATHQTPASATRKTLAALEVALPGPGSLPQRLSIFYRDFVVSADRRRVVFERALRECRSRTLAHWRLPPAETLDVEWTDSVPAAWHRYRGGWHSTLQINPDAVALPGAAIDVACHEAYPGHHAQFLLQDQRAQPAGLPVEDQVVLLRSPASVLREGAANFGVELTFPFEERVAFEERVLFPLARLDPRQARRYETVHRLVDQLSAAAVPIIASYRDHRLTRNEAEQQLANEALITSPSALLDFTDHYGAYVLGYTAVRDSVRDYVLARSQSTATPSTATPSAANPNTAYYSPATPNAAIPNTAKDAWSVLRELVSDPYGPLDPTHPIPR